MKLRNNRLALLLILLFLILLTAGCGSTPAQQASSQGTTSDSYPHKPITVVVPYNPGGGVDTSTRTIQSALQEAAGVNIVVENRPGGGMAIGYNFVADAAADGYIVMAAPIPTMIFTDLTLKDLKAGFSDFKPIGSWVNDDCSPLIVSHNAPYVNLNEFIEAAKNKTLRLGLSGGAYSTDHMTYAMLAEATGVRFNLVPYDSSGDALAAMEGGHVDAVLASLVTGLTAQEAGRVKILGVTTSERVAVAADIPTFKEQGIDVVIEFHIGLFAPPNTPDEIVKTLSEILYKAASSEEFKIRAKEVMSPIGDPMDSQKWSEYCQAEYIRWKANIETLDRYPLG